MVFAALTLVASGDGLRAQTVVAVEYYYAAWDHYFVTASEDEIAVLDGGAFGGVWKRTGQTFSAWSQATGGALPTCRFFSTAFDPRSSHFYTPYAKECSDLQAGSTWQFENIAFYVRLPEVSGNCPAGTKILYRLYNNGAGGAPNHRYTTSPTVFNTMRAAGWTMEGDARTSAFACVPLVLPYDNFSGIYIDKAKWLEGERVLEIDAINEKLRSAVASSSPIGVAVYPHVDVNRLDFVIPTSVSSFQADVTLRDSSTVNNASATARLEGVFYNDGTSGAGVIGDVFALVGIGRETNGALVGEAIIGRLANAEGTVWNILWYQAFSQSVVIGIPYTLHLAFDSVANRFTFRVGGEERIVGLPDIPARVAPAKAPSRGLTTAVYIEDANSSGYVYATFDNVYKNGIRYDDFSARTIDPARWANYESVREISGGRFRSKVRSSAASFSLINELNFANPRYIDGIQATLTLAKYENGSSGTAWADAIIGGLFYHEGTQGAGLTGDVMAKVSIGGPGNSPMAFWLVYRFDDETGWNFTDLGYGEFATPISLGTAYALSLDWDGRQFTFKLNDEVATYIPVRTIGPPNQQGKGISTLVYHADGNEAIIEALFDDVMVSAIACPGIDERPQSIDLGIVSPEGSAPDQAVTGKTARSMNRTKGRTSNAAAHRREQAGTF
jgi:hypothetical protein